MRGNKHYFQIKKIVILGLDSGTKPNYGVKANNFMRKGREIIS